MHTEPDSRCWLERESPLHHVAADTNLWPQPALKAKYSCNYDEMVTPPNTQRLRFRRMRPADIELMADMLGDPEVMRFYPAPKTREQAARWITWNEENYAEHGYGLWIVETIDGEFVGDCGLTWQEVNGAFKLEVGYHVVTSKQGRGYATEAAIACRDYARDVVGSPELVAIIHPENEASERVARKLGMRRLEDDHGGTIPVRKVLGMTLES